MKKLSALLLAMVLVLSMFAGCGNSAAASAAESTPAAEAVSEAEATEAPAAETAPAAAVSAVEEASAEEVSAAEEEADPYAGLTDEQRALISIIPEGPYLTFQSYPLSEDGESLTMFYSMHPLMTQYYSDASEIPIYQTIEEITGVHIDFTTVSFMAADTTAPLMIASGDMLDIMPIASYADSADEAIDQDLLLNLTDMLPDYSPNYYGLIQGNSRFGDSVTTPEGNVVGYSIYSMDNTRLYIDGPEIRKDWLDECGLEIPETVDEYHDMLLAFKNQIGCETPMYLHYSGINDDNQLTRAYDINGTELIVKDGEITSSLLEPGFKSYLEMMNTWYTEGLVAEDFFSDTSSEEPELAVVANDTYGLFYQYASEYPELYEYASDPDFEIQAITDAVLNKGDKLLVSNGLNSEATPNGNYNIASTCENPELAMQWMDFFFSPDGWLLCNYGTEGETFTYDEDGIPHWTDVITGSDMPGLVAKSTYTMLQGSFLFDASREFDNYTDEMIEASDIWASVEAEDGYINLPVYVTLSGDVSTEINAVESDIDTYVDECLVKFIIGDLNLDSDFDDFTANLHTIGIDDMIAAYQDAYDTITAARASAA